MQECYFWHFFLSIIILFRVTSIFYALGPRCPCASNILFPFELIAVENHGPRYKMQNVIRCFQVFFIITGYTVVIYLFSTRQRGCARNILISITNNVTRE